MFKNVKLNILVTTLSAVTIFFVYFFLRDIYIFKNLDKKIPQSNFINSSTEKKYKANAFDNSDDSFNTLKENPIKFSAFDKANISTDQLIPRDTDIDKPIHIGSYKEIEEILDDDRTPMHIGTEKPSPDELEKITYQYSEKPPVHIGTFIDIEEVYMNRPYGKEQENNSITNFSENESTWSEAVINNSY